MVADYKNNDDVKQVKGIKQKDKEKKQEKEGEEGKDSKRSGDSQTNFKNKNKLVQLFDEDDCVDMEGAQEENPF